MEMLLGLVGRTLRGVRIQSSYVDQELVNACDALYLEFDFWISLQSDANRVEILQVSEPKLKSLAPRFKGKQFPVIEPGEQTLPCIGQRLAAVAKLEWHGDVFGLLLEFDGGGVIGIESHYADEETGDVF